MEWSWSAALKAAVQRTTSQSGTPCTPQAFCTSLAGHTLDSF